VESGNSKQTFIQQN